MYRLPIILFMFFLCTSLSGQIIEKDENNSLFQRSINTWFSAWELVYSNVYGIDQIYPVDIVLFDDKFIYSTSEVSVPEGEIVNGADLLNL